jgi:glycosyltransferase involved in cell wall biosynthesis
MNPKPKISVITPSYNQGNYIKSTIESVLGQNYPNLEYIVIDGGSTDNTVQILESYGDQIDWVSEPDRGQSHALNKGFEKATGEILCFLNSDDIFEEGALNKVGDFFSNHPKAKWVTGKCRVIDHNGQEIRKWITHYKNFWLTLRSKKILQMLDYVSQPSTFWRREVLETVGYFDEQWRYAMDYDYWIRMLKFYDLHYINDYLAGFRFYPDSKAGASANAQFDGAVKILEYHNVPSIYIQMHKLHDWITVFVYSKIFGSNVTDEF